MNSSIKKDHDTRWTTTPMLKFDQQRMITWIGQRQVRTHKLLVK